MGVRDVNGKYKLVAPDGGWGYVIFVSCSLNMALGTMFTGCFGILFNDFMETIGMKSTGTTVLLGASSVCCALSGFFTHSLLKIISQRKLALLSALVMNAGYIGTIFVKSYVPFIFCQGVLPGLSYGILFTLSCTIMNEYFDKKKVFAFSFVQFIVALLSMLSPFFVEWSLGQYGFRGTLILIAGIIQHNLIAVLLMQPVKWHMKKVPDVATTEIQPLLIEENAAVIKLTDTRTETKADIEKNNFRMASENPNKLRQFVETFVDIHFFKKLILNCACLGPAVAVSTEAIYFMIFPQALYKSGWNQEMVAKALSLYGFGDLAMRTILIFISTWIKRLGSQQTYIIGLVLATIAKLGMIWSERTLPRYIYTTLMGTTRAVIFTLNTLVLSDAVPSEKFTQATGIAMMVSGGFILLFGPAIGATRDLTDSYSTAFYLLTSFFAITILFWTIELVYKKNAGKRGTQKKTSKSNQPVEEK